MYGGFRWYLEDDVFPFLYPEVLIHCCLFRVVRLRFVCHRIRYVGRSYKTSHWANSIIHGGHVMDLIAERAV